MTGSLEYFSKFDADFLSEIAKEMLSYSGTDPLDPSNRNFKFSYCVDDPVPAVLTKAVKLLEIITKAVPGQLESFYLLARAKFVMNDDEGSQRTLEKCLKLNPSYSEGHLLMAQINLKQDKSKLAKQSLEQVLGPIMMLIILGPFAQFGDYKRIHPLPHYQCEDSRTIR
jgi:hypothetical protein